MRKVLVKMVEESAGKAAAVKAPAKGKAGRSK